MCFYFDSRFLSTNNKTMRQGNAALSLGAHKLRVEALLGDGPVRERTRRPAAGLSDVGESNVLFITWTMNAG